MRLRAIDIHIKGILRRYPPRKQAPTLFGLWGKFTKSTSLSIESIYLSTKIIIIMTQNRIEGKFYALKPEEWLEVTKELRYAEVRVLYYWDLGVFGQQKRLKPLWYKGLTSIYDFP